MIDLDTVDEGYLAAWARARINGDAELIEAELDRNPHIPNGLACDVALNSDCGAVLYRDRATGSVYSLAPNGSVIGQTIDGRHVALRDGVEVIPSGRRDAAALN